MKIGDDLIRGVFTRYKTIAVYGISRSPEKAAHHVPAFLLSKDYNIIPVNPNADEILGQKCYSNLMTVPERIDIVEVFRPSAETLDVVRESLLRKEERGDIEVIWLQEGIRNEEARKLAEEAGITFVQDRCMYKEYIRLFRE